MTKIIPALFIIVSLGTAGYSQGRDARLLREASHCLVTEKQDWLAIRESHTKSLHLSDVTESHSDRGANHIIVVAYTDPARTTGTIFDVVYERKGGRILFDIQNNARFARSGKRVEFIDPPLGGTSTQTQLMSAIEQAGKKAETILNVDDLAIPFPSVACTSYADRR